jgi:hypothetical protein
MDRNGTSMLPERGLMVVNHTWFWQTWSHGKEHHHPQPVQGPGNCWERPVCAALHTNGLCMLGTSSFKIYL